MDLHQDYEQQILQLAPDNEGEVMAVLLNSKRNTGQRKSILYIHGYIDYFFQAHVGEAFHQHNYDFYALDLRKYGRALLEHQHPNYCKNLKVYYEEIDMALRQIHHQNPQDILILGHSTGGLLATRYMIDGAERKLVKGLILNSPFFDLNYNTLEKSVIVLTSKIMSAFFDYAYVKGALSPVYAQSLHRDYYGEWDFNLKWKPIQGFPTYFTWLKAIHQAQKCVRQAKLEIPILVMYSSGSKKMSKYTPEAQQNDLVLEVKDIQRIGKNLGPKVHLLEVNNAVHDIFLSSKPVRESAFKEMFLWLESRFS